MDTCVGMADLGVISEPGELKAIGIGSCMLIIMYDHSSAVGGLLHAMLPKNRGRGDNKKKFVDTGTPFLLESMLENGARKNRISAKIVGGSDMFRSKAPRIRQIGQRNITAAREALKKLKIPLLAEDVGGTQGRSVSFSITTGRVLIRSLDEEKTI